MIPDEAFTGERVVPGGVEPDLWNEHISRYRFAAQFASGKRVLDVGCGTGYGTALLADVAADALGFDVSPEAVRYASAHYPHARFTTASADQFPAADQTIDLITAFEVIEHVPDWEKLLVEAVRVLTPDGVFLVSTPNKSYYAESRAEAGPNPFHVREFECQEFAGALAHAFPHAQLLAQNQGQVFVFAGERTGALGRSFLEAKPDLQDAHFFMGVCSKRPLDVAGFIYAPSSGNLLREREHHISGLKAQMGQLETQRLRLIVETRKNGDELQRQNRWAASLDRELKEARATILAERENARAAASRYEATILGQDTDVRAVRAGYEAKILEQDKDIRAVRAGYETKITELHTELEVRAKWGKGLDDQVADLTARLQNRTARVQNLNAQVADLQAELAAKSAKLDRVFDVIRRSEWLELGRKLGRGPRFDDPSL